MHHFPRKYNLTGIRTREFSISKPCWFSFSKLTFQDCISMLVHNQLAIKTLEDYAKNNAEQNLAPSYHT